MVLLRRSGLLLALVILLAGCRKPTSANWDVDVVLPVVHSTLNIRNFLGDTIFKTGQGGLLVLNINRQIAALRLDSLLNLPNTSTVVPFVNTFPLAVQLLPGKSFTFQPTELTFSLSNGIKLKKVNVRSGTIFVKFSNTTTEPLELVYRLPGVTKGGAPFVISETVPTGSNSLIKSYDLSNYSFNMQGVSGKGYNVLAQDYTVSLGINSPSINVDYGQGALAEIGYSKIIPNFIEGYFGQQIVDLKIDTAHFSILNNFKAKNFMLSDAVMNFDILNEFGAEFTANLSGIQSINSVENKIVGINNNQLANININRASRVNEKVYPSVKTFEFKPSNSSITAFISNFPDKLTYKGQVAINPLGNISGYNDFAFYNTGIRINANINIPMRFTADYFELKSTAPVEFSNISQLDNVNGGNFIISANNGYPFSAKLQAYMVDRSGQVIDSLFIQGSNVIGNANLNAQNEVTSPLHSEVRIPITPAKIEKLKECRSIRIKSLFMMPPNPPELKILESYEFDVKIIAELNYRVGVTSQ